MIALACRYVPIRKQATRRVSETFFNHFNYDRIGDNGALPLVLGSGGSSDQALKGRGFIAIE